MPKERENIPKHNVKEDGHKKEIFVFVKNRTNQKQVLQVDGELVELQPYGKSETNLNEKDAKIKFSYWISKNIVQILNK